MKHIHTFTSLHSIAIARCSFAPISSIIFIYFNAMLCTCDLPNKEINLVIATNTYETLHSILCIDKSQFQCYKLTVPKLINLIIFWPESGPE